jgi:hypothetical protein
MVPRPALARGLVTVCLLFPLDHLSVRVEFSSGAHSRSGHPSTLTKNVVVDFLVAVTCCSCPQFSPPLSRPSTRTGIPQPDLLSALHPPISISPNPHSPTPTSTTSTSNPIRKPTATGILGSPSTHLHAHAGKQARTHIQLPLPCLSCPVLPCPVASALSTNHQRAHRLIA